MALIHNEPDLSRPQIEPVKILLNRIFQKQIEKRMTSFDLIVDPWLTDYGTNPINLDLSFTSSCSSIKKTWYNIAHKMKVKPQSLKWHFLAMNFII